MAAVAVVAVVADLPISPRENYKVIKPYPWAHIYLLARSSHLGVASRVGRRGSRSPCRPSVSRVPPPAPPRPARAPVYGYLKALLPLSYLRA